MAKDTNIKDDLHKAFVNQLKGFRKWLDEEIAAIEETTISSQMKYRVQAAMRQAAINGIKLKLERLDNVTVTRFTKV